MRLSKRGATEDATEDRQKVFEHATEDRIFFGEIIFFFERRKQARGFICGRFVVSAPLLQVQIVVR